MEMTIWKYLSDHIEHKYELVDEIKKQPKRIVIDKELGIKVITDYRKTSAYKFRIRLGFK